jgi:hypothetical protein
VIAPVGLALAYFGTEWTLRAATVVFFVCMVIALRLPPRADSDPPETMPRLLTMPGRREARLLTAAPVWPAVTAAACFRGLYGFLTLFFAFRTREDDLGVPPAVALGMVVAALGVGSLIGTVAGTRLTLRRPLLLQFTALAVTALACTGAAVAYRYDGTALVATVVLAVIAATGSGLAKLAVDAVIQQTLPEESRASGFAHSETVLQFAFVAGGAIGLIPFAGSWGLAVAALVLTAATVRVGLWARSLRDTARPEAMARPLA